MNPLNCHVEAVSGMIRAEDRRDALLFFMMFTAFGFHSLVSLFFSSSADCTRLIGYYGFTLIFSLFIRFGFADERPAVMNFIMEFRDFE